MAPVAPIRCAGAVATLLLLAAGPSAQAQQVKQFNSECGVGETPLVMKVGGTSTLSENRCSDYFDAVDPYAIVTVGSDRLGVSKETRRVDNTATPAWDSLLDFGCVEKDSRISFRVKDWDYFSDETCLGPISIVDAWPPSGLPALVCEKEAINGVGTGCISFALFYGADAGNAASSGLEIPPVPGTHATSSSNDSPFTTPPQAPTTGSGSPVTAPSGSPSTKPSPNTAPRPGPAPTTTPNNPFRNATRPTRPSSSGNATQPRVSEVPSSSSSSSSSSPTFGTGNTGTNGTVTKRPSTPPVVQAPAPRSQGQEEAEKEKARNVRRNKGAAVAGGVIMSLALVGAAVGLYVGRRRRRAEEHARGVDLEDQSSGRTMADASGSSAVL